MRNRNKVAVPVEPIDITKVVLKSMRDTVDYWLKCNRPLGSDSNHIEHIRFLGSTEEGFHVYEVKLWYESSQRPSRTVRMSGYEMVMTLAKFIGWDTPIEPWQRLIEKAKPKPKPATRRRR